MRIWEMSHVLRSRSPLLLLGPSQSRGLQTENVYVPNSLKPSFLSVDSRRISVLPSQIRTSFVTSYKIKRALSMVTKLGAAFLIGGGIGFYLASFKRNLKAPEDVEREPRNTSFAMTLQTAAFVVLAWGSAVLVLQVPLSSMPGGRVVTRSLQRVVFRWTYGGASGLTSMVLQSWPFRALWHRLQVRKCHCKNVHSYELHVDVLAAQV